MEAGIQVRQLEAAGANGDEIAELQRYNENLFVLPASLPQIPLPDELFVECWAAWCDEAEAAENSNVVAVLSRYLPQLNFPVSAGISTSDDYRAATLRGVACAELSSATGLELANPELVEMTLYSSFAGRIPVFISRGRDEFVTLARALVKRNEPVAIPPAQGALAVAGMANWHRIHQLRQSWVAKHGEAEWPREFARIRQHKELYQDRFILLSDGPYSAVSASDLGLDDERWRAMSLVLRREHECTHYFTRRLFGVMRNNVLDELIADYTGLVAAHGSFRADWFLRFVGLESFPHYRPGARLDLYRGKPPLSDGAFAVLHRLLKDAAENLQEFDLATFAPGPRSQTEQAAMITTLATMRLEELACEDAPESLAATLASILPPTQAPDWIR